MARHRRGRQSEDRRRTLAGDPVADLPDAPAMRAGLKVRQVEQHRRGDLQAYRVPAWHDHLTRRQLWAAEAYLEAAALALGSPSSCDSIARLMRGTIDGGAPDDAGGNSAEWHTWRAMHEAIPPTCRGQVTDVFWLLGPVTSPARLRLAMDAVADWLDGR